MENAGSDTHVQRATIIAQMGDLADGETTEVKGSSNAVYTLKNSGGVYSCTCPAWAHQNLPIERRTCKHLRALRGDDAEKQRLGTAELGGKPVRAPGAKSGVADAGDATDGTDGQGPPLLLAHKWETDIDITGWWLSEKLDGVRAYWDGTQFLSRLGNRFHAPPWFTASLPKTPLDGELWGGRKLFQRTVGIVKRQDQSPLWKELLYVVFDAPAFDGAFEERMAHLEALLGEGQTYARVHGHIPCTGHDQLRDELARVEGLGGEGLMARRPNSRYEAGRSSTLLKVKTFKDAEARVVAHVDGQGKHKGRLGALLVELADGTRFNVGTGFSDREREAPPEVGALITFRYQELSDGGVPRFPSFVAERFDASGPSSLSGEKAQAQAFRASRAQTASAATGSASIAPPPKAPLPTAMGRRRFEMTDGEERYFWEIVQTGRKHRVRFGTFENKTKTFESEADAAAALEKRIQEKLDKGFVEVETNEDN
jgi:DNA ligase-1